MSDFMNRDSLLHLIQSIILIDFFYPGIDGVTWRHTLLYTMENQLMFKCCFSIFKLFIWLYKTLILEIIYASDVTQQTWLVNELTRPRDRETACFHHVSGQSFNITNNPVYCTNTCIIVARSGYHNQQPIKILISSNTIYW